LLSASARAEPPVTSDFSVRANASVLRDLLGSQVGAEVGANVSLTPRFDVAAAASLGSRVGGRFGVTWHLRDDGEWVRPFVQARALLHSAPDGVAAGGGAWAGLFVPLGPGRIQAGALFEAYGGPKSYVPYDAFVTLGYELDIFRRVERQGIKPGAVEAPPPAQVVQAQPAPQPAPPEPAPAPPPAAVPTAAAAAEPTRVVTRINFSRDVITFDERRAAWDIKADAVVRRVAETLKRYPSLKRVEVAGHADDGDDEAQCLKISVKRSDAVVKALVAAGVAPERLVSKGYGNTRPKVSTKGPARKREQNRRVDFTVLE
jgi:outer membrane protein OmpA-like peptidoglycan-associated protein